MARKCRPGQFVILMPDEKGERIPLSIADWDAEKGIGHVGLPPCRHHDPQAGPAQAGDELPVYVGPLGKPSEIANFGTVLLAGGCFGIGAIYPLARALKQAGNRVIAVLDAKANYLLYWEDKLRAVSDKVVRRLARLRPQLEGIHPGQDQGSPQAERRSTGSIAIGCTYLMYACSMATKPLGIKTIVSLNPIMVDGTGMCGACRCTAAGQTKFACVDGPDFDGHEVDWEELFKRRKSYFDDEIRSLCHWERNRLPVTGRPDSPMSEEKKAMPPEAKARLKAEFEREWRKELRKAVPLKERMKIARQKMPERPPDERNRDFREVNLGLDAEAAQAEARRCLDCANPAVRHRLPGRHRHPELRQAHRAGQVPRGGLEAQGDELPPGHLRPRLPPGNAVRGGLQR